MFIVITSMIGVRVGSSSGSLPLIYVNPPTCTASTLKGFAIDINVANISDLQVAEFKLGYNTTILDATNVTQGPFMKIGYNVIYAEINDTLGYVYVSIAILSGGLAEGSGTLASITFNTTYYGSVSCVLDLYDTELSDSLAEPIIHEVVDGYYEFIILTLTVATSKPFYLAKEDINIYGNLKQDDSPVDGLVALEVKDPSDKIILFRTLKTGTNPPIGNVTIIKMYPCDEWGNPKNSFKRGPPNKVSFNVTVKNNDIIKRKVMITVNVYDDNTVPFGVSAIELSILPGTSAWVIPSIDIPGWVSIGTASAYANAFTGEPILGGVAYCPERPATFEITGSTTTLGTKELSNNSSTVESLTESTGSYSLTFKLISGEEGTEDRRSRIGTYNVYVSSSYQETHDKKQTTFNVGVPGDVDGDGDVDIYDLTKLAKSWQKKIGDLEYNPNADFNNDGIVDIYDLTKLALNWHKW